MQKRAAVRGKQVKASRQPATETPLPSEKPAVSVKSTRASRTAVQSEKPLNIGHNKQEVSHAVQPLMPPGQNHPCGSFRIVVAMRQLGENAAVPVSLAAALAQEELLDVESRRHVWL